MQYPSDLQRKDANEVSLAEWLIRFGRNWKLFLFFLILCTGIAFAYVRYYTPVYQVNAKIVINDPNKEHSGIAISVFNDLGSTPGYGNIDNELQVLISRSLIKKTVDSLNQGVSYFREGRIKDDELYKRSPVFVYVKDFIRSGAFHVDRTSDDMFVVRSIDNKFEHIAGPSMEFITPWGLMTLEHNLFSTIEFPIKVVVHNPNSLPKVGITPVRSTTGVFLLSITTPCPEEGKDLLRTLIDIYNEETILAKNYTAINTSNFINERLDIISGELRTSEMEVDQYKREHSLSDPVLETQMFLSTSEDYAKKISEVEIQRNILLTVKSFLLSTDEASVIPTNSGLVDPTILSLIGRYNEEVFQKKRSAPGMLPGNAALKEYNTRIATLKEDLLKGINISLSGMDVTLTELRKQENVYAARVRTISTQEREYRELYRQKEIKESLFIYLLQKREETSLTMLLATPNVRVIDEPTYSPTPVAPDVKTIMTIGLLLGLFIPVILLYARSVFDTRVHYRQDIIRMLDVPFAGDIPVYKGNDPLPVTYMRSGIAEKFRIVAANLNFIDSSQRKIVMVTSSVSGEGKSFICSNLALSLATSGKKCLLLDLDIRQSRLKNVITSSAPKDLPIYLADPNTQIDEIIDRSGSIHKNLDLILTTIFPPNPAELLASTRLDELFGQLKDRYDYIIVDTPPVGLVADAFRINTFTTCSLFVTRLNHTYKEALKELSQLYHDGRLTRLCYVINGVDSAKQYGYYADKTKYYQES